MLPAVESPLPAKIHRPHAFLPHAWLDSFSRRSGLAHLLLFLLFYTVLANIPFWAASHWLGLLRNGWFSLDYLAAGLIALFLPRIFAPALLLAALSLDALQAVTETYFLSVRQCFSNFGTLREFPQGRILNFVCALLLALLVAAASFFVTPRRSPHHLRIAACLIALGLVFVSFDAATWKLRDLHATSAKPNLSSRLSRVPTLRLARALLFPQPIGFPAPSAAAIAIGSATPAAYSTTQPSPNIVLILVESWGLSADPSIRNALLQPYGDLNSRFEILRGTVPFRGPTVAGEARELCGSDMGPRIEEASTKDLQNCLPMRLSALGYRTIGMHGWWGDFFSRTQWYNTIGFQDTWFIDRLRRQGLPTCEGAFNGICDAAIAEWIAHRLAQDKGQPDFLFWVTLGSHLPVPVPAPLQNGANCSFAPSLASQPQLCSWYQLVANLHRSVADLASSNLARPTIFVIVGDHAPPYDEENLRAQFSPDEVPYIILKPRHLSTAASW